jgi:uncharacterized membrane protein YgcG
MKLKTKIIWVVLNLTVFIACSPKIYEHMGFLSRLIVVDGKQDEWDNPLRYYDKQSKLTYEVRNDNSNIYIAFKANEMETVMRIIRNGICLSIDTAYGKDDYPISITFPVAQNDFPAGNKPDDFKNRPKDSMGMRPPPMPDSMRMRKPASAKIKLVGFSNNGDELVKSFQNRYGIEAAIESGQESIFLEIKIPFSALYKRNLTPKDTANALFFEVNLPAMSAGDKKMMPPGSTNDNENGPPSHGSGGPPQGGGGMFGGGGGMSGGGMPSGGPPGGGGNGMGPMVPGSESQATPSIFRFQLRPVYNK